MRNCVHKLISLGSRRKVTDWTSDSEAFYLPLAQALINISFISRTCVHGRPKPCQFLHNSIPICIYMQTPLRLFQNKLKTANIKACKREIKQREHEPDSFGSTGNKSCFPLKRPSANFATIIYLSHITTYNDYH
jgi:uncharacterized protein Yka (UPF0111/DUF47 family)